MTEHEMRVRLAEAMGYHRCKKYRGSPSAPWMGPDGAYTSTIPNPLDNDRDAALLRAWCVGRGWDVEFVVSPGVIDRFGPRVLVSIAGGWTLQVCVLGTEEPDPCRRERLALCRAVLQALDTIDAGGEA